jgi:hypothetical protein
MTKMSFGFNILKSSKNGDKNLPIDNQYKNNL